MRVACSSIAALWLAACLEPEVVRCADGRLCPAGTVCDEATEQCLLPEQVEVCAGAIEGDACEFAGGAGVCRDRACVSIVCGDGLISGLEQCEPTDLAGKTCLDFGAYAPAGLACGDDCQFDLDGCGERCGDDVRNGPEDCDGVDLGELDCVALGFHEAAGLACNAVCGFDLSGCVGTCGDGDRNGDEDCEGADLGAADCRDLGFYDAPGLACTALCTYDDVACTGFCGDGEVSGGEVCDATIPDLGGCLDFGYDAGALGCTTFCAPDLGGCASIGWRAMQLPEGAPGVRALWGAGPDVAFAAATGGAVLAFDGAVWSTIATPTGEDLLGIWGSSATDAWAVGAQGAILHFDGAWTIDEVVQPARALRGVWGSAPDDVWAVGDQGTIAHWNGVAWSVSVGPSAQDLHAVWGTADDDVYAVGASGTILRWNGVGWSAEASPTTETLRGGALGIAVGDGGTILERVAGVWGAVVSPVSSDLRGVFAVRADDVFAVGDGGVVVHHDGAGWLRMISPTTDDLAAAWGASSRFVLAAGDADVLAYRGSGWAQSLSFGGFQNIYSGSAVWGSSADDVLVATNSTSLRRFDGTSWSMVATPAAAGLRGLWGFAADRVFAIGNNGTVLRWDGASWTAMATPVGTGSLAGLWGSGPADVYALQRPFGQAYIHFDGTAWTGPASSNHWVMWGSGPGDVFTGGSGEIQHFDGSGWEIVDEGQYRHGAVWGSGPADVYVAAEESTLVRWDGVAWAPVAAPAAGDYDELWGTGPDDVFLAGTGLLHFDGAAWARVRLPDTSEVVSMWGTPRDMFFVSATAVHHLIRTVPWSCRAAETGCGDRVDDDCDDLVDADDPDCLGGLRLHEIHGGAPAFVEILNRSASPANLHGIALAFRGSCDVVTHTYQFPADAIAGAGEVYRAVDVAIGLQARERIAADICHAADGGGWFALCAGPCDLTACTNLLDYVELLGSAGPMGAPACASFSPAPLDVLAATVTDSATRTGFAGGGADGVAADWSVAPVTRE